MSCFDLTAPLTARAADAFDHERVLLFQDPASGLKAIVAIHSTALGTALGGVRFQRYDSDEQALVDVLRLSRGMSYKNAVAGLDFGGGKAVIVGDPDRIKSEELLLAFGRSVASLEGRYVTACDVGTDAADMEVVARTCRWTVRHPPEGGSTADLSVLTALGVLHGIRAAAYHRWGTTSLRGRTVGIAGVGKVGRLLADHLFNEGARLVATDVREEAVRHLSRKYPQTTVVADTEALIRFEGLDVYAPCALGGVLNDEVAPVLTAEVVCGSANNQLTCPEVEKHLADRGILYVPDYVVNAGGVIQAAGQLRRTPARRILARVEQIFDTTLAVLERAATEGELPGTAADRIAEQCLRTAAEARVTGR